MESVSTRRPSTADPKITEPEGLQINIPKDDEEDTKNEASVTEQYSWFTKSQLKGLRLLLGFSAITSPLTATIYFPLLPLLRSQFGTSTTGINFTLTIYVIFQAISPVLFGPLSDTYGRRPMFLFTLALYTASNIGLAVNQHNYPTLLVLRALQSLGASAAYSIAFGVVVDVCVASERGQMLGPIGMAMNLGACVGPVVGGVVAYIKGSHNWVFWSLVIVGAVLLGTVGSLIPETARNIVGNGCDRRRFKWWQLSWLGLLKEKLHRKGQQKEDAQYRGPRRKSSGVDAIKTSGNNFFACIRIIFHRDTFLALWIQSSFYTVGYCFVAALPDIYEWQYHYNKLYVGLAYLPRGVGITLGSYLTGKLMDRDYNRTIKEMGWTDDKIDGDDLMRFPIERARSRSSHWMLIISTAATVAYGWIVDRGVHPAVPLILQLIQGFWDTYFYITYSALVVDVFPESPSTAAATTSVTRCVLAAVGISVLDPLLTAVGLGWLFTLLGLLSGVLGALAVFLLRKKGMAWRQARNGFNSEQDMSA